MKLDGFGFTGDDLRRQLGFEDTLVNRKASTHAF